MNKLILIGLCISLVILSGCSQKQDVDDRIIMEIRCSNKELWDNRAYYPNFECSLEYLPNNQALRICTATYVWVDDDFNVKRMQMNTTCLSTCYKNCYYNGRRIY